MNFKATLIKEQFQVKYFFFSAKSSEKKEKK